MDNNNQTVDTYNKNYQKYLGARERACELEGEMEDAGKKVADHLIQYVRKIQAKFYQKYGNKIDELDDLHMAIGSVKKKGMKQLQRDLHNLYLLSEQEGGGEEVIKNKSKQLVDAYKQKYCPDDNFQKKRDAEAMKLKSAILGLTGEQNNSNIQYLM